MQETNSSNTKTIWIIVGVVVTVLCCCLIVLGAAGIIALQGVDSVFNEINLQLNNTSTPTPASPIAVERTPADEIPLDTLQILENTIVPANYLPEIACRLEGKCDIPVTLETGTIPRTVGETDVFWAISMNPDGTDEHFEVNATLEYVTDHAYFWVQDGVEFDTTDMKKLMDTFEAEIYPTTREFFGSEWSPGVDGDEHIYVLYTRGIGYSIAGYYSSADEYHPLAHEYSNAHEMFIFNADNTYLHEPFTYGVLTHEFQHMIHWNLDRNETSWLNEGFSELATFLNDMDPGGFDWVYVQDPDMQLNDWPNDQGSTTPHYGASFMFTTYFLDRFDAEATQALAADEQNGMDSVDNTLESINATDPISGDPIRADDVVIDWLIANFLKDPNVGDGRYTYHNYPEAPQPSATENIYTCPAKETYNVHQYGGDYIQIECAGDYTLHFEGATQTGLLPTGAYSGDYAFWTNKGDESDMTLTRRFDFSNVPGPITLSFQTWYDIETDYDYVYLEVSEDGEHWQIITTPSGTGEDPSGNSYGWAYNGVTNGWMEESVDLSDYAGKEVYVRFEYVTDAAVNGEGMLIDDLRIEAIDYFNDFESDDGGWEAAGFVRVQNILPQTFEVALISTNGGQTTVERIALSAEQTADIPISINSGDKAVLVVTGTTRFTRELANYSIEIK
jgi:immune inhibitor A